MRKRTANKRRRMRIGDGIYRDGYGLSAKVAVGTGAEALQRSKRFPMDTSVQNVIKPWQDAMRAELRKVAARPVAAVRGTLEADVARYLPQVKHLISYKSRVCETGAWTALYGRLRRAQITAEHVRKARAQWMADNYTAKTVNNRVQTLRHLYRLLDGDKAPTPCDEVKPLAVAESVKVMVNAKVFRAVAANLPDQKIRARFMVIASTGCRPSELKRAEPADVDLEQRVWQVRTGKGGRMRAFYLNDEMLMALAAFVAAKAWGAFDASDYAKALYAAGWPKDVRPYQARHSVALEMGERGIDLGDVSSWLGHRDPATTRKFYMGVLASRQKTASESLDGRFSGWLAPEPDSNGASAEPLPAADLEAMETVGGVQ